MSTILLDTNAYSHFLRGDEKVLRQLTDASVIHFSIFVMAELYYGFSGGKKEKENRQYLQRFLQKPGVSLLKGTTETADFFALIKRQLKDKGQPIPLSDVWIAAHAMEAGATLITYDQHFSRITGLRLWDELEL